MCSIVLHLSFMKIIYHLAIIRHRILCSFMSRKSLAPRLSYAKLDFLKTKASEVTSHCKFGKIRIWLDFHWFLFQVLNPAISTHNKSLKILLRMDIGRLVNGILAFRLNPFENPRSPKCCEPRFGCLESMDRIGENESGDISLEAIGQDFFKASL